MWHTRLGHISKERLEKLVNNEILSNLDFIDLYISVNCIKGKHTRHSKKEVTRSKQLREIIHTNICGPFDIVSFSKEKYFFTFFEDFSHYGYVYLLHERSQAINCLEIFISQVERQLERKVKIIRSNRDGENYWRYDEKGQRPGPFAMFIENHDIYAQYTMPITPQQKNVQ